MPRSSLCAIGEVGVTGSIEPGIAAADDAGDGKPADVIRLVEEIYDADVYGYSAGIDYHGFGLLVRSFRKERTNALLILTTNGGLANAAYRIARFLQTQYESLIIFIPSVCKSAGTLVCIGANRLIMGQFSELGPLDVQLYERDEIFSRKSGLLSHSAFEALKHETFQVYEHILLQIKQRSADNISFPVASSVAEEITSRVMAPIYEQISPNVLGSDYRDLQVAIHYGQRLALHSENITFDGVRVLTEHFPSHDFIIDAEEASALFRHVEEPDHALWKLIGTFGNFLLSESDAPVVLRLSDIVDEPAEDANDEEDEADSATSGLDGGTIDDSQGPDPTRREGSAEPTAVGSPAPARRKARDASKTG